MPASIYSFRRETINEQPENHRTSLELNWKMKTPGYRGGNFPHAAVFTKNTIGSRVPLIL